MARDIHDFILFADYFQFHIADDGTAGDLSAAWDEAAVARMLALAPGIVGLGTARNMEVPVRVELLDAAPADAFDVFDHVVEGPLQVASGRITVAGCTDHLADAARIALAPGSYRLRLCAAGLGTLSDDGLDGGDRYRVQLWPAPPSPVQVLKQWRE